MVALVAVVLGFLYIIRFFYYYIISLLLYCIDYFIEILFKIT